MPQEWQGAGLHMGRTPSLGSDEYTPRGMGYVRWVSHRVPRCGVIGT